MELIALVHSMGALGVFIATFAEEVFAPLPSAAIVIGASSILTQGIQFGVPLIATILFLVALPAAFGFALGSAVMYGIIYYFGKPVIVRFGPWIGVSWSDVESYTKLLSQSHTDEYVLIGLRATPFVPSILINLACGVVRYPIRQFLITTLIGGFLRAFILGIVGWYVGKYLHKILESIESIVFILTLAVGVGAIFWLRRKKKKALN